MSDSVKWDHLTGINCYSTDKCSYYNDISVAIDGLPNKEIDPVSVLSILMKNYAVGDRTLVSGVTKLPWLSEIKNKSIIDLSLPVHEGIILSEKKIARNLVDLMKSEALSFLENKKSVGILLSGGMDSRVIAAIINKLQADGLYSGSVTALTWGIDNCRDVEYAKRIADIHKWDFKHFPITPETLLENIKIAGVRGAEYSPVHLHAMPSVANLDELDGILAGSYGDSIGRGEYSGRKVGELPSILSKHYNHHSFMLSEIEKKATKYLHDDIAYSLSRFPGRSENAYREIEMQMHYMRRQLNSCMSVIDEKIPLYQMFTSPEVFGFMWSLSNECRTDGVYESILLDISPSLLEIPWARDGRIYNKKDGIKLDNLDKSYHRYGDWLRNDNRDFVIDKIMNGNLESLNIFNRKALHYWAKNWRTDKRARADQLDEKMAWLASLSIFVEEYDIKGLPISSESFLEDIRLSMAIIREFFYYNAIKKK